MRGFFKLLTEYRPKVNRLIAYSYYPWLLLFGMVVRQDWRDAIFPYQLLIAGFFPLSVLLFVFFLCAGDVYTVWLKEDVQDSEETLP